MSSILGLLLVLLLVALVLNVVARLLRVAVADDSCRRRPWLPTHWREPIEEGEEIRVQIAEGVVLSGTFLPRLTDACRGTIVYSHELNGDRWNALTYVEHLRADGFDVFTFDYRNHGRNQAHYRQLRRFDVTEADIVDLQEAVRVAASKSPLAEPRVGIIGVGKGAAVALCAAARNTPIGALVLDSIQPLAGQTPKTHASLDGWCRRLRLRLFGGPQRNACDPVCAAQNVRVPVLLIHGRNDVDVPLAAVRGLASKFVGQCQLWIVPGARHAEAIDVQRVAHRQRTSKFLLQALQAKRPSATRDAAVQTPAAVVHHGQVSSAPAQ